MGLFRLARSGVGGRLVHWVFCYMSFIIPVERLRQTKHLIAFHHPRPGYPVHILLVPTGNFRHLLDLTTADAGLLTDLFQTVASLVQEFQLEQRGYRLIVNGGPYQEIPHLHFHLISEQGG